MFRGRNNRITYRDGSDQGKSRQPIPGCLLRLLCTATGIAVGFTGKSRGIERHQPRHGKDQKRQSLQTTEVRNDRPRNSPKGSQRGPGRCNTTVEHFTIPGVQEKTGRARSIRCPQGEIQKSAQKHVEEKTRDGRRGTRTENCTWSRDNLGTKEWQTGPRKVTMLKP